jgi:hypothetical protein
MNSAKIDQSSPGSGGVSQRPQSRISTPALGFCRAHGQLVVFLVAFAVRIAFILAVGPTAPPLQQGDDQAYDWIASTVVTQHVFIGTLYPPGYPLFLTANYVVFGRSWFLARLVQAVVGAGTCLLTYRLGAKVFSERVGLVSGILLALYPGHVYFSWRLMAEPVYMLLLTWSLLMGLSAAENPTPYRAFVFGVLVGAAQLVKANLFLIPVMFVVWFAFSARCTAKRRALCVGTALSGLVLTVFVQSVIGLFSTTHEFRLLPRNGGVTLWVGNNPDSVGFTDMSESSPATHAFIESHGFVEQLKTADPVEKERIYSSLAVLWIRENPGKFLALMPKKLENAFGLFPRAQVFEDDSLARRMIHLFTYGPVALLGLAGMMAARRRWRACSLLYVVVVSYVPTVLIFYGTPRWTLMIIPELVIFASFALLGTYDYLHQRPHLADSSPSTH